MNRVLPYATGEDRRAARDAVRDHLDGGGILVYPTETVYGLGCRLDPGPLGDLVRFKGPRPFLLLIEGPDRIDGLQWTDAARRLADAFWPGPLTLALTAEPDAFPPELVGPDGAVAVRVSPHPGIPDLLEAAGGPLTSTSANVPGDEPARDGEAARAVARAVEADGARALTLDAGRLPQTRPSTIVRCGAGTRVLRDGAVSREALQSVVELE